MTTSPQTRSPEPGESGQTPEGPSRLVESPTVPPANIEHAVTALGDLLNLAFSDAVAVDQLARQTVKAFGGIDAPERIQLAEQHPGLVKALLLLENQIDRMDRR